ncbi:hypothetical protein ASPVEDRAFT_88911 [Aspergillus versicolor CBS 583.65]|uniref:DUF7770 domain-containing protein n=1 Tax=Aspergillus versicolor CBS 583.65 TaxID=1036611 RepID=A0A1L9Q1M7_ASPVE|nr:uncharacterized protein ASPVEDRAFT_88911 [Aspergillus versicolor CBS 583.65]OJJ07673.1 hypothetical protein ASPVEDRAFT_88911 [Aspergillus versicolor CBS 583.65]
MTEFKPIHFIPEARQEHILSLTVQRIIAAPHHQDAGTNHWCFYLVVSPSTSIKLDCVPSYSAPSDILPGGSKAYLILSELDYLVPDDVEATFNLDVPTDIGTEITVDDILEVLIDNNRHMYGFDSNGAGCRFWVTEQLEFFYDAEYLVDGTQVQAVKAALVKLWPEQTPLELDKGAYYDNF